MRTLDWIVVLGFAAVVVAVALRLWLGPLVPKPYRRPLEIAGIVVVVLSWGWSLLHL